MRSNLGFLRIIIVLLLRYSTSLVSADNKAVLPNGWTYLPKTNLQKFSYITLSANGDVFGIEDNTLKVQTLSDDSWKQLGELAPRQLSHGGSILWVVDVNGRVHYLPDEQRLSGSWRSLGNDIFKVVKAGHFPHVFGLKRNGNLYIRAGVSRKTPSGTSWQLIRTGIRDIAVNSYSIWIADLLSRTFCAPLPSNLDVKKLSWKFVQSPTGISRIFTGFDSKVWAYASNGVFYRRTLSSSIEVCGKDWVRETLPFTLLSMSASHMFGLLLDGNIATKRVSECGGILRPKKGNILSPRFPANYPDNADCLWIISVPGAKSISLRFTTFDIEDSSKCTKDFLLLYKNGKYTTNDREYTFLCAREFKDQQFNSDEVWIAFHSDSFTSATGFRILYDSKFDETGSTTDKPIRATSTAQLSSTTPTPTPVLRTGCGGDFTDNYGLFASPNYPSLYPNNLKCIYQITVDKGKAVELRFDEFDIENDPLCRFDFIHIRDGNSEFGKDLGKHCGLSNDGVYRSTGNQLWIFFRADGTVGRRGFKARWRAINNGNKLRTTPETFTPRRVTDANKTPGTTLPPKWSQIVQPERFKLVDTGTTDIVWALHSSGVPYVLESYYFVAVQGSERFSYITAGESGVWGITTDNRLLFRVGVAPLSVDGVYWQSVPDSPRLRSVDSGPNGVVVAVDVNNFFYQRDGVSSERPKGTRWKLLDGAIKTASVGSYGYWLVDVNNKAYFAPYIVPGSDQVLTKQQVEGQFIDVQAGFGSSVWAIGPDNSVYKRGGINALQPSGTHWEKVEDLKLVKVSSGLSGVFGVTPEGRIIRSKDLNCGGILSGRRGTIRTPNYPFQYPPYSMCLWIVHVPDAKQIKLTFKQFNIEPSNNCDRDYVLTIKNGRYPSINGAKRDCGTEVSSKQFVGPTAWIEFVSDGQRNYPGFEAEYVAETEPPTEEPKTTVITTTTIPAPFKACGGKLSGRYGRIAHPKYPNKYQSFMDCEYVITAEPGEQIQIHFLQIGLQDDAECAKDFIEIRDGKSESDIVLAKSCGVAIPRDIESSTENIYIRFQSDSDIEDSGFLLEWKTSRKGGEIITDNPPSPATTEPLQACGGIKTGVNGVISHPGYPGPYKNNQDCVWKIFVTNGYRIEILFDTFELEYDSVCAKDYVILYDGSDERSPVLERSCGEQLSNLIYTSGNTLTARFVSDSEITKPGFRLYWKRVQIPTTQVQTRVTTTPTPCSYTQTGSSGTIYHNNYPQNYKPNQDCTWTITVAPNKRIKVSFDIFQLEEQFPCANDYMILYDGPTRASKQTRFCGKKSRETFFSSSNSLTLRFVSDNAKEDFGFYIRWFAVDTTTTPLRTTTTKATTVITTAKPTSKATTIPTTKSQTTQPTPVTGLNFCSRQSTRNPGVVFSPNFPKSYPNRIYCQLTLQAPQGSRIRIDFMMFELEASFQCKFDSFTIKDGVGGTPSIKYCGATSPPAVFTSLTDNIFLTFRTDSSGTESGFKFKWTIIEGITTTLRPTTMKKSQPPVSVAPANVPKCGELQFGQSGIIRSPRFSMDYPYAITCLWVIEVGPTSMINVNFQYFDLGRSNCETSYVIVRDSKSSDGRLLGKYCERNIPTTIRSTGKYLWIEYKTKVGLNQDAFVINWNAETLVTKKAYNCGGILTGETGAVSSPGFPNYYPHNSLCVWMVKVPQGSRVLIRFSYFDVEDTSDCQADYVKVIDGDSSNSRIIKKSCGRRNPGILTSTGNSLWIELRSDCKVARSGFRAVWRRLKTKLPTRSPRTDNNGGLLGPEIATTDPFVLFPTTRKTSAALPTTPGKDYPLSTGVNTEGGLILGLSGIIKSPNFPRQYPLNARITWILQGPPKGRIRLKFRAFELEEESGCRYDHVQIRNGNSVDAEEVGRFCGSRLPANYISGSNSLWVRFKSDASLALKGFEAEWEWVPETSSPQQSVAASSQAECGGIIKQSAGMIRSPKYPDNYPANLDCTWIIRPPNAERIQLVFNIFEVEDSSNCISDYLELRKGDSPTGTYMGRLCGRHQGLRFMSDRGAYWIHFKTDDSKAGIGFEAEWVTTATRSRAQRSKRDLSSPSRLSTCGGKIVRKFGKLELPLKHYPQSAPLFCRWIFKVPAGQELFINVKDLTFKSSDSCSRNLFEVRVPYKKRTALLYRHCGDEKGRKEGHIIRSKEKEVEILYKTSNRPSRKHFIVTWDIYSKPTGKQGISSGFTLHGSDTGCSQTLIGASGSFNSPNYPRNYPTRSACTWKIAIPDDRKLIKLTFDSFSLEEQAKCRYDYVLIRDGDSPLSRVIGKYCGSTIPSDIRSTGNTLLVEFYSDAAFTSSGFRAVYETVDDVKSKEDVNAVKSVLHRKKLGCGGKLTGTNGEFMSPNYPNKYPRDITCKWVIENNNPDLSVLVEFEDFKLEHGYSCQNDYVLIRSGVDETKTLGKYCGSDLPESVTSDSLQIEFRSDESHQRRGFRASWKLIPKPTDGSFLIKTTPSPAQGCGGYQTGFVGFVKSSNYPGNYKNYQNCQWVLTSQPYTQLQLRFSNFDLEFSRGCLYDYVAVYDGRSSESQLIGKYCGQEIPELITSTSNNLYIVFFTDESDTRGGFDATWVSEIVQAGNGNPLSENLPRMALDGPASTSCGGFRRGRQGVIQSPNFPRKYSKNTNCVWNVQGVPNKIIEINVKSIDVEYHRQCKYDRIVIRDGNNAGSPIIASLCGSAIPKPIRSSGSVVRVQFYSDGTSERKGFVLQWKSIERKTKSKGCGGVLTGSKGLITSPSYTVSSGDRQICSWEIDVSPAKQIKLTFKDLDIRAHPSCGFGYVQIHDGDSAASNEIGLFCGSFIPRQITTSGSKALIGYFSDTAKNTRGFKLQWEASTGGTSLKPTPSQRQDTPCDAILRQEAGSISMSAGKRNCTWTVQMVAGRKIILSFKETDLSPGPNCDQEYLEVREGITQSAPVLVKVCGQIKTRQLTTYAGVLRISYVKLKDQVGLQSKLLLVWKSPVNGKNIFPAGINVDSCGMTKAKATTKFVDGRGEAASGSLPWVAALTSGIGRAYCGASLISNQWLLTAAHCFERFPIPSFWEVVVGEVDLSSTDPNKQMRSVQNIFLHPSYDPVSRENDIALVQLNSQVTFNDKVNSICLADASDIVPAGTVCSTAGWGSRRFLGNPSIPLIHVRPPLVSQSSCNSTRAYNGQIRANMICAGRDEGGVDSCQGDGGGPIVCKSLDGKNKLYGISSWGNGCAFPFKYGVYTDTRKYLTWIFESIRS